MHSIKTQKNKDTKIFVHANVNTQWNIKEYGFWLDKMQSLNTLSIKLKTHKIALSQNKKKNQ